MPITKCENCDFYWSILWNSVNSVMHFAWMRPTSLFGIWNYAPGEITYSCGDLKITIVSNRTDTSSPWGDDVTKETKEDFKFQQTDHFIRTAFTNTICSFHQEGDSFILWNPFFFHHVVFAIHLQTLRQDGSFPVLLLPLQGTHLDVYRFTRIRVVTGNPSTRTSKDRIYSQDSYSCSDGNSIWKQTDTVHISSQRDETLCRKTGPLVTYSASWVSGNRSTTVNRAKVKR